MKRLSALERARLPLNDLGNARRLYEAAAGHVLWLADAAGGKGTWVAFDGTRWSVELGPAQALAAAHRVSADIGEEIKALRDADDGALRDAFGPKFTREMADERCGQMFAWHIKSGDAAKTSAMLSQFKGLRDEAGSFVTQAWLADFDTDDLAYHCTNGTLRFIAAAPGRWTAQFTPGHRASDRFMQIASVGYDAAASAPAWEARMALLHKDSVQRDALQRIYGMTLTGRVSDQAFYIFQGLGQDGKSLTNDVICGLHGAYARKADPKTFLEGPTQAGAAHQSDIVRLAGDIRLVVTDEPRRNSTWDGQRIKQVTGSELIARGAHAVSELSFKPRWNLIAECNQLPRAPSDDHGFQRRHKIFLWTVQFGITPGVDDEPFETVKARLAGEASGILNWMIAGTLRWLDTGEVPPPAASRAASESFWEDGSPLKEWMKERTERAPDAYALAGVLYADFKAWCLEHGHKEDRVMSQTGFGRALTNMQILSGRERASDKKTRLTIRLRDAGGAAAVAATPGWADDDLPEF